MKKLSFPTDRFLVNKWLFTKTNEHSGLFRTRFVRHYEGYILREFQRLRLNLNEYRASEKKTCFDVFYFFPTEPIDRF